MRSRKTHFLITLLAIAIGYCPTPLVAQVQRQSGIVQQRSNQNKRVAVAATELGRDLQDARNLLRSVNDRRLRREIEALLARAQANLVLMKTDLLLGESTWTSLTDSEFQQLLNQVKRQSISKKKAEYLRDYVKLARSARSEQRLSSSQVRRLLAEIEFDNDRVPTAILLFEVTSDKPNYLTALEAITFDRNRKTVQRRLGFIR